MTKDTNASGRETPTEPAFHTVKETAGCLRLYEKQVRRLISRGELPAYRFGTALRIKREDIDTYVSAQQVGPVYNNK
ncbi:MAG: helix-turn-helix domain-containing protein [Methyloceanibacter sp.]|uniref:helix-turn-helix domain-containing protein n=1 Tax=Methyloceanibacter sp. TaxID=1965321 RepID=UPI003D6C8A7B